MQGSGGFDVKTNWTHAYKRDRKQHNPAKGMCRLDCGDKSFSSDKNKVYLQ